MKKKMYEAPSMKVHRLQPAQIICSSVDTTLTGGTEGVSSKENGFWSSFDINGESQTEQVGEKNGKW